MANHAIAAHVIAVEIKRMVVDYNAGKLKRSSRDFISGLVKAYGLVVEESNADRALNAAMRDAEVV